MGLWMSSFCWFLVLQGQVYTETGFMRHLSCF